MPAFRMPPPRKKPCPRVTVKSSMFTAAPLLMLKTRLASLPLTASRPAPGPSIRRSSVMPNSPLVRATVPRSPWAKAMTSAPGLALAAVIAARSEPGPLSARLFDPEGAEDDAILELCDAQPARQEPLREPCGAVPLLRAGRHEEGTPGSQPG